MAESERVTIRLPDALHAACKASSSAAGVSLGEWLRTLAERATGVKADVREGLMGVSAKRRLEISRGAIKAKREKAEEAKRKQKTKV